jgi:outer membrane murein-binding lipoprotein Lpp
MILAALLKAVKVISGCKNNAQNSRIASIADALYRCASLTSYTKKIDYK